MKNEIVMALDRAQSEIRFALNHMKDIDKKTPAKDLDHLKRSMDHCFRIMFNIKHS